MTINVTFEQGTGFAPRIVRITTNSTLAQVVTAGWLNSVVKEGIVIQPSDKILIYYGIGGTVGNAFFDISIAAGTGIITLSVAESNVVLPVVAGDFANFSGTSGSIADLGYLPSDATKTRVVMAGSAVQVGYLPHFVDVTGTLDDTAGAVINAGTIQSGLSGTVGGFIAYPTTASNGFLELLASNAGGAFNTIISNSAMLQTSTISIPDPGASTAKFILSALTGAGVQHITSGSFQVDAGGLLAGLAAGGTAGALTLYPATAANGSFVLSPIGNAGNFAATLSNVTGLGQASVYTLPDPGNAIARVLVGATATPFTTAHILASSGTGGLVADSGIATSAVQLNTNIKANRTANIGGAGAGPISVAVAGMTAASIITANIQASSNVVSVSKVTATSTGFDILFSADPGATATVNYITFIVAQ